MRQLSIFALAFLVGIVGYLFPQSEGLFPLRPPPPKEAPSTLASRVHYQPPPQFHGRRVLGPTTSIFFLKHHPGKYASTFSAAPKNPSPFYRGPSVLPPRISPLGPIGLVQGFTNAAPPMRTTNLPSPGSSATKGLPPVTPSSPMKELNSPASPEYSQSPEYQETGRVHSPATSPVFYLKHQPGKYSGNAATTAHPSPSYQGLPPIMPPSPKKAMNSPASPQYSQSPKDHGTGSFHGPSPSSIFINHYPGKYGNTFAATPKDPSPSYHQGSSPITAPSPTEVASFPASPEYSQSPKYHGTGRGLSPAPSTTFFLNHHSGKYSSTFAAAPRNPSSSYHEGHSVLPPTISPLDPIGLGQGFTNAAPPMGIINLPSPGSSATKGLPPITPSSPKKELNSPASPEYNQSPEYQRTGGVHSPATSVFSLEHHSGQSPIMPPSPKKATNSPGSSQCSQSPKYHETGSFHGPSPSSMFFLNQHPGKKGNTFAATPKDPSPSFHQGSSPIRGLSPKEVANSPGSPAYSQSTKYHGTGRGLSPVPSTTFFLNHHSGIHSSTFAAAPRNPSPSYHEEPSVMSKPISPVNAIGGRDEFSVAAPPVEIVNRSSPSSSFESIVISPFPSHPPMEIPRKNEQRLHGPPSLYKGPSISSLQSPLPTTVNQGAPIPLSSLEPSIQPNARAPLLSKATTFAPENGPSQRNFSSSQSSAAPFLAFSSPPIESAPPPSFFIPKETKSSAPPTISHDESFKPKMAIAPFAGALPPTSNTGSAPPTISHDESFKPTIAIAPFARALPPPSNTGSAPPTISHDESFKPKIAIAPFARALPPPSNTGSAPPTISHDESFKPKIAIPPFVGALPPPYNTGSAPPTISHTESLWKPKNLFTPFARALPPPPNTDCFNWKCEEPYTNTPSATPCGCVLPIQVGLRLGVALFNFFPLVSELAKEIAAGVFMKQNQVRIMGANAANQDAAKTIVLIDLVPLTKEFNHSTAFLTFKRFWHRQVLINASLFGEYEVLYVIYPGLPSPPSATDGDGRQFSIDNNSRTIHPLAVDVSKRKERQGRSRITLVLVLSSIALILFIGIIWLMIWKRAMRLGRPLPTLRVLLRPTKPSGTGLLALAPGNWSSSAASAASISLSSIALCSGSIKTFSINEIEKATSGFDALNILGEGGFGRVYRGVLENGAKVAVKVLKREDEQGNREFSAEVETLSRLHHRNLVKLIGICREEHHRCLVYELIPNGSVDSYLHGVDKEFAPLDWLARLKIALGAAQGLAYMHEDSRPHVIHRDFKSSNILLDHDFTPKVCDFGLARTALEGGNEKILTRVMGTFGYVAPEYAMTGHLLVKSDVYSYGVVLLELLTGRKPVDMSRPPGQENLVTWARPLLTSKEGLEMIIDPALGTNFPFDSAVKVAAIASMCIQEEVSHRPFMGEVVEALKLICNESHERRETESSCRDILFAPDTEIWIGNE